MPAHETIRALYDAINRRDLDAAMEYVDEACVYEDLNFPQPFQGKAAVRRLFEESCQNVPADLQFVIDELTTGDAQSVGLLWHVELDGIPFPNGRGASFYRISDTSGKLVFARDLVEPPLKPGKLSFAIIRLVTPLVRRLLKRQMPAQPATQPAIQASEQRDSGYATVLWMLTVAYVSVLLLSPPDLLLPGEPAWAVRPDTWQELRDESLNFFFVLPLLSQLNVVSAPQLHPATEAFFNFAEAWIFMFLPLLLADPRGYRLPRVPWWGASMFLTNVFLMPYMARRATAVPDPERTQSKGMLARAFGVVGFLVGAIAVYWFLAGRPEFGGVAERSQFFLDKLTRDRVTIAFAVDLLLFGIFQAVLMGAVEPVGSPRRWLRYVPFWGLAIWLIV